MKKTLKMMTSLVVVLAISCIKPAHEEEFGPLPSKSCTDGILNQGEYFTDCGGPCAPCPLTPYVNFVLDSTPWVRPDTLEISVKSAKDSVQFLDSGLVRIFMADAATPFNSLTFVIDGNWRGVHEVEQADIAGAVMHSVIPGSVALESGVVTITNVDEVNGLISGEFKFNCAPASDGRIWSIVDGEFRDQRMYPAQ